MTPVFRRFYDENRWPLQALVAALAINVAVLLLVRPRLDAWVARTEAVATDSERQVEDAELQFGRSRFEAMLLETARERIDELNDVTLQSNRERYPTVELKIKAIAASFGLSPQGISYSRNLLRNEGLERLTVTFRLKGGYPDLRRFVSEIEQARDDESGEDLFFAIEQVGLQDSTDSGRELNLNLSVATYFYEPELAAEEGPGGRRASSSGGARRRPRRAP